MRFQLSCHTGFYKYVKENSQQSDKKAKENDVKPNALCRYTISKV